MVVLAGGEGRRLGGPKAWLEWDGRPLLLRVLERLAPLDPRPIVVARPGQALPSGEYARVDDEVDDAGPLAGLTAGLTAASAGEPARRLAVCACDYPFADPALFRGLAAAAEADVIMPRHAGHDHPLHAVWRAGTAAACAAALAAGERRVRAALERLDAVVLPAAGLAPGVDPDRALLNLNDPDDLARARSAR